MTSAHRIFGGGMTHLFFLVALSFGTLCSAWSQRFQYPQSAHQTAGNFLVVRHQAAGVLDKASPKLKPNPCYVCNQANYVWDCRDDVGNEEVFECADVEDNLAISCGVMLNKTTGNLTRSCGSYAYNKCGYVDSLLTGYYCTCGAGNKCNDFNMDFMRTMLAMEKNQAPYNWNLPPPDGKQLDFSAWRKSQQGGHYTVHVGYPGGSATSGDGNYATMAHDWNSNEPIHLHFTTLDNGTLVLANGNTDPNKNHTHNDTSDDFALKIKLRLVFHMPPHRELTYINGTPYDLPWPPAGTNTSSSGGSTGGSVVGPVPPPPPVVDPNDGKPVTIDLYPPCGDNPASIAVCLNTKLFGYALTDLDGCTPNWCCCMSYCKGLVPTPHQCPIGQFFDPDPAVYTCKNRVQVNSCRKIDKLPPLDPGAGGNGTGGGTGGGGGGGGQIIDDSNLMKSTPTTTPSTTTTVSPAVINSVAINGATWPASKCYDRCDDTFCKNKADGTYENSPCSRNFCTCQAQQPRYYGCGDGTYFDGSTMKCKAGNSTWCPSQPPTALARLADLPGWQKDRCSLTNCQLRNGQFPYFALDCCSRYWCYCKGSGSSMVAEVQTCDANTYFDHRSEWVQCRDLSNFGFCPARGNNLYQ